MRCRWKSFHYEFTGKPIIMAEQENTKSVIAAIKFSKVGKNYHFDASNLPQIQIGDSVVVETARGLQIGKVTNLEEQTEKLNQGVFKPVNRITTPADLEKQEEFSKLSEEATQICKKKVREIGFQDIKIVTVEFSFDGRCLTVLYSCEDEESPNLQELQKALRERFNNPRVEFHKVGPRDVARFCDGMGACGLETRCCVKFINEFQPISIKMAKTQDVSLTPQDITGMCDRLRCCLNYEYCHYLEALNNMPKKNKIILTPLGEGKVKELYPLRNAVLVELPEIGNKEFLLDDLNKTSGDTSVQAVEPHSYPQVSQGRSDPNLPRNDQNRPQQQRFFRKDQPRRSR